MLELFYTVSSQVVQTSNEYSSTLDELNENKKYMRKTTMRGHNIVQTKKWQPEKNSTTITYTRQNILGENVMQSGL